MHMEQQVTEAPRGFFAPEAPGLRGWVGIGAAALLIIANWAIDAVVPGRREAERNGRIPARAWIALGVLLLAISVLLAAYVGIRMLVNEGLGASSEPIAIYSPLAMDARPIPAPDAEASDLLPDAFGAFLARIGGSSAIDPQLWLHVCLDRSSIGALTCGLTHAPRQVAHRTYLSEGQEIEVLAASFADEGAARAAISALTQYQNTYGRLRGYGLGAMAVTHVSGQLNGWHTYTWAHGAWVYSVAAPTAELAETAAAYFPY